MSDRMATEAILNPTGRVEPAHVGQMFWDPLSEVFYQARGPGAHDWRYVPPRDLPGSFVKIYDFFLGLPPHDAQGDKGREWYADNEVVRRTMELDGVRVAQAFAWRTAAGANAMMARIIFGRVWGLSLFFGFDMEVKPHRLPTGLGITVEDGFLQFGDAVESRQVHPGDSFVLRIETHLTTATAYIDDRQFARCETGPIRPRPVVTLFVKDDGPRATAPGYETALKRMLDR